MREAVAARRSLVPRPEDHDPEPRQAERLDRLETRDDAEGAVVPPAPATVPKGEPVQSRRPPPGSRPIRLPAASTSTSSPASRKPAGGQLGAASSSGE